MRRTVWVCVCLLAAGFVAPGCGNGDNGEAPLGGVRLGTGGGTWVLDRLTQFSIGHDLAMKYIDREHPELREVYDRAIKATVRVRIHHSRTPEGFITEHGTGVIVGGGRYVLTAGHVLSVMKEYPDGEPEIVLPDGSVLKAIVVDYRDEENADWGIIEIPESPETRAVAMETGEGEKDELAIYFGFPANAGLGADGRAEPDAANGTRPLRALAIIVRVHKPKRMTLDYVAGFVAEGGMSGGPVIDASGKVIAIETAVTRGDGPDGATHGIDATPVGRFNLAAMKSDEAQLTAP